MSTDRLTLETFHPDVEEEVKRRIARSAALQADDVPSDAKDDAVAVGVLAVTDYWWETGEETNSYPTRFPTSEHNLLVVKFAADRGIEHLVGELEQRREEDAAWELYDRLAQGGQTNGDKPTREKLKLIWAYVGLLPDVQRRVIECRFREGLTQKETAPRVGYKTTKSVRTVEERAIQTLRKWLAFWMPGGQVPAA